MDTNKDVHEVPVSFHPALYLQRRGWVLDIMRREGISEVLDIGCGEGELLSCLCNPAPWLVPPPQDVLPTTSSPSTKALLEELHHDALHPTKIAGLDISRTELDRTAEITAAPAEQNAACAVAWARAPARWEPLEVTLWEGSLAHVNPAFIDIECIVATEVIEHLPEDVLERFAPVTLGAYQPRMLLITTPSYTFNARFTAPDAPREARSGWPDPTGRTDRIFRHDDHRFEWTVNEFKDWCETTATTWGYDIVDIGGVGRAAEADEWGRDEELGWASQVAAFRRREGPEWKEERRRRWEELHATCDEPSGKHALLATHQHAAHEDACHPEPLEVVAQLVVSKMVGFGETAVSLTEMWFEPEIERACGGWVDWLVHAIETHSGLSICKSSWAAETYTIQLDPDLQLLISPDSHSDAWASPTDSDEVEGLSDDPLEVESLGEGDHESVVVKEALEDVSGEVQCICDRAEIDVGEVCGWGDPNGEWGKTAQDIPSGLSAWYADEEASSVV